MPLIKKLIICNRLNFPSLVYAVRDYLYLNSGDLTRKDGAIMSVQETKECFLCGTPGIVSRLGVEFLVQCKCPNCKVEWVTLSIARIVAARKRRAEAQKRAERRGKGWLRQAMQ